MTPSVGLMEGERDGDSVVVTVGVPVGEALKIRLGVDDGAFVFSSVGFELGLKLGPRLGLLVGLTLDSSVSVDGISSNDRCVNRNERDSDPSASKRSVPSSSSPYTLNLPKRLSK